MISEDLLQFIWQYSLYNPAHLKTTNGESLTVQHPGRLNKNAGPDFDEAKIKIGNTLLVGNVELHLKASDWKKHQHQNNKAYQNIILHVVYEDDQFEISPSISTVSLKEHIPVYVLERYTSLIQAIQTIPCASQLQQVATIVKESWLNRMLAERWEEKLEDWKDELDNSHGDWSSLFYWRLAANFGFKINATPFQLVAKSIPLQILAKHKANLLQIEALIFGQAGFLQGALSDAYTLKLQQEYSYLKSKYSLQTIDVHLWKFLRLRPANFPTIRLAQFAALIHQSVSLFSQIITTTSLQEVRKLLQVSASSYWEQHYRLEDAPHKTKKKMLGESSIDNIIINTIAPLRFLFANNQGQLTQQEAALQLLTELPAEHNHIISNWSSNGWQAHHAADTQALIQLYNQYCSQKKCLKCSIGLSILKMNYQQ